MPTKTVGQTTATCPQCGRTVEIVKRGAVYTMAPHTRVLDGRLVPCDGGLRLALARGCDPCAGSRLLASLTPGGPPS